MGTAPIDRPDKATPLLALAGVIHAAPGPTFQSLARHVDPGSESNFASDGARWVAIVQGDWWYRGEYRVLPHDDGSRIEYEIINVAPTWHWAGAVTGRGALKAAPQDFRELLTAVASDVED
jgi:hypothetical protein